MPSTAGTSSDWNTTRASLSSWWKKSWWKAGPCLNSSHCYVLDIVPWNARRQISSVEKWGNLFRERQIAGKIDLIRRIYKGPALLKWCITPSVSAEVERSLKSHRLLSTKSRWTQRFSRSSSKASVFRGTNRGRSAERRLLGSTKDKDGRCRRRRRHGVRRASARSTTAAAEGVGILPSHVAPQSPYRRDISTTGYWPHPCWFLCRRRFHCERALFSCRADQH